jgi:cytochrome c peroxidase
MRNVEGHLPALMGKIMSYGSDPRLVGSLVATDAEMATLGRFVVTRVGNDVGRFRTPSLRYVADTAPYMHDGSIPTIEAAVEQEVYWRGLASGAPVALTVSEREAIVAFLNTLRAVSPECPSGTTLKTRSQP